jgi:branched-chain amino acid aminotransferase
MLAYLNGQWTNLQNAAIPVWDFGFTMGVSVTEQMRTFNGKLHCLDFHLQRLKRGLEITGIQLPQSIESIGNIATDLTRENYEHHSARTDLSVGIVITPGSQPGRVPKIFAHEKSPTVLISANRLPFQTWADSYQQGLKLVTASTREIPEVCLPKELKCRSRMHYYLAEKEVAEKVPGAKALLLDLDGYVAEATIGSVLTVSGKTIIAPPKNKVLPGVSVRFLEETICPALGIEFKRENLKPDNLLSADELLWLSTSPCVLPIAELDGHKVSSESARPMFWKIVKHWSEVVGVDIVGQAQRATL